MSQNLESVTSAGLGGGLALSETNKNPYGLRFDCGVGSTQRKRTKTVPRGVSVTGTRRS